ncbi:MAG: hypothetical protein ACREX3_05485, partial [Gammaproteobacteria bacterium]
MNTTQCGSEPERTSRDIGDFAGGMSASYEENLEERLRDLCDRVHRGRYRPQPVRRVYIPK